jgi:hypothetical protein
MDFISTPGGPRGLAVDGRHIYWTTNSTIGRANLDGSNVDQSFIDGTSPGRGMAVEAPYLYWVTSSGIGRASIDGTGVDESFIRSADTHSGVAVNAQHVFWGVAHESLGGSSIGRANLDGTGVDPSFITGATFPRGLAVSFQPLPPNVPTVGVSPPKLDFGSQPVSTLSPPSVLTVSNTGTAPLKISSVRVSTGDVDEFLISRDTCTNSTLPIDGAPCVIGVRFGPIASGPRSATLRIVSNDPASPRQVALSGIGAGCAGQEATIVGTGRADKLPGTKRDDVIVARGGDDRVFGVRGHDLLCGGAGADVIRGMRGGDRLRGGRGKDRLRGGRGRDRCRGGSGSDRRRHC